MDRDNTTWLRDLRGEHTVQAAALDELRGELLRRLGRALSGRAADDLASREDVVQDAILKILDRLDDFSGRSKFLTWATSITIHLALDELRRRRWRDVSLDEIAADRVGLGNQAVASDPTPDVALEQRSILETLGEVIEQELTSKQRIALVAELRGMPLAEIARQMGSNRNAVYKLTHDARRRLKRGLQAAGYQSDDIRSTFA